VTLSLSVALAFGGRYVLQLLTDNPHIISIGATLLIIDVLVEIGRPINIFATNALRSTGDVNYPFYVGLVVMWTMQVAGGWFFGIFLGLGINALWLMISADEITRGVIFVRRWWSKKWANKSFVAR
jgi:Na+-driven multidrug efflux pump